jgi:hypothetical protein
MLATTESYSAWFMKPSSGEKPLQGEVGEEGEGGRQGCREAGRKGKQQQPRTGSAGLTVEAVRGQTNNTGGREGK